ncbi:hypothetical protein GGR46_002689 [Sphingomonas kyeonggiensis]|uniref:Uncharacterized protein n=1 Tax=Sphingomonas kyeonggiensis TaxID=1268553 RepID=A0A7W6JVD9_9SPHN|nr:hypothetical protein [Sphingomonas kyeonggiensis]
MSAIRTCAALIMIFFQGLGKNSCEYSGPPPSWSRVAAPIWYIDLSARSVLGFSEGNQHAEQYRVVCDLQRCQEAVA